MKFTTQDADRILGLADQELEDWEQNEGASDPDCRERRREYDAIRPLWVRSPDLLALLARACTELEELSFLNGSELLGEIQTVLRDPALEQLLQHGNRSESMS